MSMNQNEGLRWMLTSINNLLKVNDYFGAFVMCLNAVDPLAHRQYPTLAPGARFTRLLREERQMLIPSPRDIFLPDARSCGVRSEVSFRQIEDSDGEVERWKAAITMHEDELKKSLITIEEVMWKYCRNPVVHEGSPLALNGNNFVTLDWSASPTGMSFRVDQRAKSVIVIGAAFWLSLLYHIVVKHLGERRHSA